MARRAAFLKTALADGRHRLLISGGDYFPPGGAEERGKGETILRAIRAMNYDALGLGDFDFAHGTAPLLEATRGLPVVTTNIEWTDTHKLIGQPMLVKSYEGVPSLGMDRKKFKVAVLSFMDERLQGSIDFYLEKEKRKVQVTSAAAAAREWIPAARRQADVVVALVHMNIADAMIFAQKNPGLEVVVAGHAAEQVVDPPRRVGSTWVVANGDRARFVGELRLTLGPDLKLLDADARQLPLDEKAGEDTVVAGFIADFKMGLARERGGSVSAPLPGHNVPSFAGVQVCASCHKSIVDQWKTTDHARAYATLSKTHDEVREECLKCHVVGLGTPGGFDVNSPQLPLADVQCENCHGSGVRHSMAKPEDLKSTIIGHPRPASCLQCHNSERDPTFSFGSKWQKIKH